jgi:hypothetical protein
MAQPTDYICFLGWEAKHRRERSVTGRSWFPNVVTGSRGRRADPRGPAFKPDKAIEHALACVDIMDGTGGRDLKIWLPDGLNYLGQGDLRSRQERLADSLAEVFDLSARPSDSCSSTSCSSRLA